MNNAQNSQKEETQNGAFNTFSSYLESLSVVHHGLPQSFFNPEGFEITNNSPVVEFNLSAQHLEGQVYRTKFDLKIHHRAIGKLASGEEKTVEFFTIDLSYVAMTHIGNAEDLEETQKRRILVVDVPNMSFPQIAFIVFNLTREMGAAPIRLNPYNFLELFLRDSVTPSTVVGQQAVAQEYPI